MGKSIWGFKEVRCEFAVALPPSRVFPGARFIHLTRRISDCLISLNRWEASGIWKREWTRRSINHWISINQGFLAQGAKLRKLLSLRYEDMIAGGGEEFTQQLAKFLDLPRSLFNLDVFMKHLDGADPTASKIPLSPEDWALISRPKINRLNEALRC